MGIEEKQANTESTAPRVSVIVPAFNEAKNLFSNLTTLQSHLQEAPFTSEILVVDDGSADDTAAEAMRFASAHENVTILEHPANYGLGQAMKSGFKAARGSIVVSFDSDLSYSPDHIDQMVNAMETTGASVVVASPYMDGGSVTGVPRMRAIMSKWANRILRRLSLHHISTVTGMVRAYERDFIEGVSLKSMDNQINAEIIYKATLLRRPIVEVPGHLVWTRDDEETKKRSGRLRFVTMIVDSLFSGFIFRPFTFFIIPGAVLMILAIYGLGWAGWHIISFFPDHSGSFLWVLTESTADAFELSPHSFVIGGILMIVAFQLISVGIISAQNKRYFEELWFQGNWMSSTLRESIEATARDSQKRDARN